jgi:hypothetical protein
VALVRTEVSGDRIASFIRAKRIRELGTNLAVTRNTDDGSDTFLKFSVLTTDTRRHIPEDGIRHSHGSENLKLYTALTGWSL